MPTLLLCLILQDARVEELLLEFGRRGAVEAADLDALVTSLEALGTAALLTIAQALAEDLRDGMRAAAAPALVDTLVGHGDKLEPLRAAYRDPATPPAGRLEIAWALDDLGDGSWRDGVRAMARDRALDPDLRRRAAELLRRAGEDVVVDVPAPTSAAEPAPAKKAERSSRLPGTMAAALFLGGSVVFLGLLLWALRRKD